MIEAERVSRIQRLKFNKKLINRIVIVSEFGRTWKGKITNVIDHETFQIENQTDKDRAVSTVDIYQICRVIWEFLSHSLNWHNDAIVSHSGFSPNKTPRNRGFSFGIATALLRDYDYIKIKKYIVW